MSHTIDILERLLYNHQDLQEVCMCSRCVPKDATAEERISFSDLEPADGFIPAFEADSPAGIREPLVVQCLKGPLCATLSSKYRH